MTIEELNRICKNTFVEHLGINFTEFDGSTLRAEIKLGPSHLQPQGVVHGGVYIAMAETVAGAGSSVLVENERKIALGASVNSHHISSARSGRIYAFGELIHKSDFKHIWDVRITDESGKLISISRVSNSIKDLKNETGKDK